MNKKLYLPLALAVGLVLFFLIRLSTCTLPSVIIRDAKQDHKEWLRERDSLIQVIVFHERQVAKLNDSIGLYRDAAKKWQAKASLAYADANRYHAQADAVKVDTVSRDAKEFTALVDSQHIPIPASIQADTARRGVMGRTIAVAMYCLRQRPIMQKEIRALRASVTAKDSVIFNGNRERSLLVRQSAEKDSVIGVQSGVIHADSSTIQKQFSALRTLNRKKNEAIIGGSIGGLVVGAIIGAVAVAILRR